MLKVCVYKETGNGRLGGHNTEFAFTGLPGVEIAALADSNPDGKINAELIGARRFYSSFAEMMEVEAPDIVVLCSRIPSEHYTQIKYALQHNAHVLCEKPLAENLIQADELIELSHKTGKLVQIAHPARFAPTFKEMKRLINDGAIGRVLTCYMRGKEDYRGGGEDMLVLATHIFDIACWLFGRPLEVFSDIRYQGKPITANATLPTAEPVGPCAGDEILSFYRFPNNINGIFESRRDVVTGGDRRLGITVCGTKGSLTVRYTGLRDLRIALNSPVPIEDDTAFEHVELPEEEAIPGAEPIDLEKWRCTKPANAYFTANNRRAAWNLMQGILHGEVLQAGIETAVESLEMICGAYQSALLRKPVTLPLAIRQHPLEVKE